MTTQSFLTAAGMQAILIRKPLQGIVLVAPYSATALTAITSGAGAANGLDTGVTSAHKTLGRLTSDGVTFANSPSIQSTRGFGDAYPVRRDVESLDVSLSFTALETNFQVLDNFTGVSQTGNTTNATTHELTVTAAPLPPIRDKRVLAIFRDTNPDGTGDIYLGIYLLRANITQNGDQAYSFTDACLNYPMQAAALNDDVAGAPYKLFYGGPGFQSMYTAMGYS